MTDTHDYLAVITNRYGGGSWARGADKLDLVKRTARIYREDWKHYFLIKKGTQATVNVIDVTGYDEVWWDYTGFWCGKTRIDRPVEQISYTY